tara:strand:+ start:91 stop:216 length:126 start_codon:yes stop_codon:yes gene_type:complete
MGVAKGYRLMLQGLTHCVRLAPMQCDAPADLIALNNPILHR